MLSLKVATPPRWFPSVAGHLEELLIDHAHCEKKAAGAAMNLIFAYIERVEFVRALTVIVDEELDHFRQVLDRIEQRGWRFRGQRPGGYGRQLHELIRPLEPQRAVDRCLVAALIEARSCERFAILRDNIDDRELASFYGSLFESEARHHGTYVQFARQFADDATVQARMHELSGAEAEIILQGDRVPRMHS